MSLVGAIKIIFIIVLLVAYVYLMAWESISKYLEGGIMVEVSTAESNGLEAPAITICATGPSS